MQDYGMDPARMEAENEAKAAFMGQLSAGEHVLWAGKPSRVARLGGGDVFVIPFSIFWLAFSVFWTVMASTASVAFGLFGVPFILVGLFLLFGRFLLPAWKRKRTYYALTERRVIELSTYPDGSRKSLREKSIAGIRNASVQVGRKGTGTIVFGAMDFGAMAYRTGPFRTMTPLEGFGGLRTTGDAVVFADIDGCNRVYDLYVQTKARAEAATGAEAGQA